MTRDERVRDLYYIDQTTESDPSEDGLARYIVGVLRFFDGTEAVPMIKQTVTDSVSGNVVTDSVTGDVVWSY